MIYMACVHLFFLLRAVGGKSTQEGTIDPLVHGK